MHFPVTVTEQTVEPVYIVLLFISLNAQNGHYILILCSLCICRTHLLSLIVSVLAIMCKSLREMQWVEGLCWDLPWECSQCAVCSGDWWCYCAVQWRTIHLQCSHIDHGHTHRPTNPIRGIGHHTRRCRVLIASAFTTRTNRGLSNQSTLSHCYLYLFAFIIGGCGQWNIVDMSNKIMLWILLPKGMHIIVSIVCLLIFCLFTCISWNPYNHTSPIFSCVLPVVVAQSSCGSIVDDIFSHNGHYGASYVCL